MPEPVEPTKAVVLPAGDGQVIVLQRGCIAIGKSHTLKAQFALDGFNREVTAFVRNVYGCLQQAQHLYFGALKRELHMRQLRSFLLSLVCLFSLHAAWAQTVDATSIGLAKELLQSLGHPASLQEDADSVAAAVNPAALKNRDYKKGFSLKVFKRELPGLVDSIAQIYADNFTPAELKGLNDFFKSQAGRSIVDVPRLLAASITAKPGSREASNTEAILKAASQAGEAFQATALGKTYADRVQNKIEPKTGPLISAVFDKARAAGVDR